MFLHLYICSGGFPSTFVMDSDVDVIEFKVPTESSKTLFIWEIHPDYSETYIYECLHQAFTAFGALYWLKVFPSSPGMAPAFHAVLKFYSAAQASRAQKAMDGRHLFQKSPLKVKLCRSQKRLRLQPIGTLSAAKCKDLANHYLGFNGWSSRVVTLKELSNSDETQECAAPSEITLKYGCVVEVTFQHHPVSCRGVGVAEEVFQSNDGPITIHMRRGQLQKCAMTRAVINAFGKVVLIVLGCGKVVVECKIDPDEILPDEEVEGVIKVNDISWSQRDSAEEDDDALFSDLMVNLTNAS